MALILVVFKTNFVAKLRFPEPKSIAAIRKSVKVVAQKSHLNEATFKVFYLRSVIVMNE